MGPDGRRQFSVHNRISPRLIEENIENDGLCASARELASIGYGVSGPTALEPAAATSGVTHHP